MLLQKRLTKVTEMCVITVLLLGFELIQIKSSPLTKKLKLDRQKELSDVLSGSREGIIVFGEGLKHSSVEDESDYQAEYMGLPQGQVQAGGFWQTRPKLLCEQDYMKYSAFGPMTPYSLYQDPSLSLADVPTSCHVTVKENPLRLVLEVPYHGCSVFIQDGSYNLKLSWNGIPVTLMCPKPDDMSTTVAPTSSFFPPFPFMPLPQETTTAAPQEPPVSPQISPGLLNLILNYWLLLGQSQAPAVPPQYPVLQNPWGYPPFGQSPVVPPQDLNTPPISNYLPPGFAYFMQKYKMHPYQYRTPQLNARYFQEFLYWLQQMHLYSSPNSQLNSNYYPHFLSWLQQMYPYLSKYPMQNPYFLPLQMPNFQPANPQDPSQTLNLQNLMNQPYTTKAQTGATSETPATSAPHASIPAWWTTTASK